MRSQSSWSKRARRLVLWVLPGALAFGTSCLGDMRKSLVAAGLDFVEGTAGSILQAVIPVDEILSNE